MTPVAESIRTKVAEAKPGTLFTVDEFDGSPGAIETALSRLEKRGEIKRVRKGLYFKGVRSRFGSGKPSPEDVVYKLCGMSGVGPTRWSAARALGLTTQLPARAEFALVKAPLSNVPEVDFHSRSNLERLKLNPTEIAVFEILRDWPMYSEASWEEFVDHVAGIAKDGIIEPARLESAAKKEPSPRLRRLLSDLLSELHGRMSGHA